MLLLNADAFYTALCIKITIIILNTFFFLVQATALLQKNLENAKASLDILVTDLQFLRDQVTITQVLLADMPNFFINPLEVLITLLRTSLTVQKIDKNSTTVNQFPAQRIIYLLNLYT